jgi:hypothetical protein
VVGAARLDDGRLAVMNAGSNELRIYDESGAFVSAHGREGEGPGEFRGATRLNLIGDTLAVYDARLHRLSLHDKSGTYLTNRRLELTPGRFGLDEWLYDRSWVVGPPLGIGRAPVIAALAKLPPPDSVDAFRYVLVTQYGQLWVRERTPPESAHTAWRVHDMNAKPLGRIRLPRDFEPMDIGRDYIVGRTRDALDVEYVHLLRFQPTITPRERVAFVPSPADTLREATADSSFVETRRAITGSLRMLNNAQEIYYSTPENNYRYATDVAQLGDLYDPPEGVHLRLVTANERGWLAVAVHRVTGRMCAVAIGFAVPPGWIPGSVACQ